ncbi:RBBP9/YdeN family alpha/beta hydrolase [Solimonas variicoloris]|uniref:RBBP9/YdeN family alpha/beta hydrolase n=1 Tax=Solimonas variicoloris TaxID=254408 RepID=UPI000373C72B|nr:alpha/beta hydrolase [Solimonas variicoloris]
MDAGEAVKWAGPVLVAPGLRGSGEAHWQTRWARRHPHWRRVEQADWNVADLDAWARRIVEAVLQADAPVLIVAHSFGCLASVRAAAFQSDLIAAALLVAPADPDKFGVAARLAQAPLPFASTLVASRDDPWLPQAAARRWAGAWGSRFVDIGARGHVNADSGLGDWAEGLHLLDELARRSDAGPYAPAPAALRHAA